MFSDDDNIKSIRNLINEIRDYAGLRVEFLKLDFVGKLITLLSALLLAVVLLVIFAVALLFLSYTVALLLADVVGSLAGACAIVAGVDLLLGLLVYIFRHTLIMRPTASFIARIFLEKKNDTQNKQQ